MTKFLYSFEKLRSYRKIEPSPEVVVYEAKVAEEMAAAARDEQVDKKRQEPVLVGSRILD